MTIEEIHAHINSLLSLSTGAANIQGRYLSIHFPSSNSDEVARISDILKQGGPPCLTDDNIDKRADGSIESVHITKDRLVRIFQTFRALFNSYFSLALEGELKSEHESFVLLDKSYANKDIYGQFKTFQGWLNLFKSLTKNFIYQNNNSEIKFYLFEELEDEKKVKSHELVITNADVHDNFFDISPFLHNQFFFGEDDRYAVEKNLICKSALIKTIKSIKAKSLTDKELLKIMITPTDLLENYESGYEFYTKKYSIDKFTREVEVAKIEYFEKINAIIHDNQAKALTIPVVILGTSLLRSWDVMSAILILTAMLLALYLVVLNLEHKITAINDCVESAQKALGHLTERTPTTNNLLESSSMASKIFIEIKDKGKSAECLLKNIRLGTCLAAIVWLIYMVCFYLNSSGTCPLS
ncbi:hypothetical protein [Vibrio gigantis]|uniref:hypothetical protein n=1 Tax=Vibrio gigantis TaxID=296199 RepID=UPI002FC840E5